MSTIQKRRFLRAIASFLVIGLIIALWDWIPLTRQFEQSSLDLRYRHFNRAEKANDRVVVIDIDEQSMKLLASSYGRWPWPRKIYKDIIEFLAVGEPASILFDLLFTEPQFGSNDDQVLGDASAQFGYASHAVNFLMDPAEERDGINPLPPGFGDRFGLKWNGDLSQIFQELPKYRDYLLPAPEYMSRITKTHSVAFEKDADGVYRRAPLIANYDNVILPALSLQGILSTVSDPQISSEDREVLIKGTSVLDETAVEYRIPLDSNAKLPLHFYHPERSPMAIPIAAVMDSAIKMQKGEIDDPANLKVNPLELQGKVILIGGSAAGLEDLKSTPVHASYPGVMLHATVVSNVLDGSYLTRLSFIVRLLMGFLILGITLYCVYFAENIVIKIVPALLMILGVSGAAILLFQYQNIWVDMTMPITACLLALFDGFVYVSFVEGRERKKLQGTLSKYLSPAVTQTLINEGINPQAEVGHFKELSVMFSDIRGFTSMSESLKPQMLVDHLNEYLGDMTDVIFQEQGTLDKFIGDAIMAFWGAPLDDPEHAIRAVRCGFGMQRSLVELKKQWLARGESFTINVGVGVNTGKVIVGNIGSEKRLDYTVIGDNVNLASRIEGLTKQYKVGFLVGEGTEKLVKNSMVCRIVDQVRVKGKAQHVKIYEPLSERGLPETSRATEVADRFTASFAEYVNGNFEKALRGFEELNGSSDEGDGPSQVYIDRCRDLVANPPQEWDGIYTATSK